MFNDVDGKSDTPIGWIIFLHIFKKLWSTIGSASFPQIPILFVYNQGWATSGFIRNSWFFFFTFVGKKNLSPASWLFFLSGKKWRFDPTLLQTCHSSRFNQDIPIFQYKSRGIPIFWFYVWKSQVFVFVSKLEKQKGFSLCRMSHVSKPTKLGLKINFMIGWIEGLGWILCTARLSE